MFNPFKWLLGRIVRAQADRMRRRFLKLTETPREVQRKNLLEMIRRNERTAFGQDHHFAKIRTVEDFRREMPIRGYEHFAPYIERVKKGETSAMFAERKVHMFAMTSGTTASRKYIPVTDRFLNDYRRGWMIWGLNMYEDHPELWFKTMMQITSDWDESRTEAGIPCGSISGFTVQVQRAIVRRTYCLPPAAAKLKDIRAKYYLAWRLGLVRDVAIITSANPSTLVNIARFGTEHAERLIRDLRDGSLDPEFPMNDGIRQAEAERLKPNPARAKELEAILSKTGGLRPKDVWPNLGVLANWTGGSVGAYMRHYPEWFGDKPAVRDIGLVASEGRMTVPVMDGTPAGILEISSSFFEFVPVAEMGSENPITLEAHELEADRDYYILLTTSSGLYRYNIFDVVRCMGWYRGTPLLGFLNKGANFSNLTGEKLSEHQIVQAVRKSLDALDLKLAAFTLAPCWDERLPYYGLFVEESDLPADVVRRRFADEVETRLRAENSEYGEKRDTLRLAPVKLHLMPAGAWKTWDAERLRKNGGTAEQYKHPCLIPDVAFAPTMPTTAVV